MHTFIIFRGNRSNSGKIFILQKNYWLVLNLECHIEGGLNN